MWSVSGHYPYGVEADTAEEAVEKACDKVGNGWEWEAKPIAMTEAEIVLADLDAFRARCEEAEYTDSGEAWVMIDRLEAALRGANGK